MQEAKGVPDCKQRWHDMGAPTRAAGGTTWGSPEGSRWDLGVGVTEGGTGMGAPTWDDDG